MAQVKYGGTYQSPGTALVTGMGSGSNDGWQRLFTLPAAQLPNLPARRYVIMVKGRISNVQTLGGVGVRGVVEVALGTDGGQIGSLHRTSLSVRRERQTTVGTNRGLPFMFMMAQQLGTGVIDPEFGPTWDNTSGAEFAVWGRFAWNNDLLTYSVTFEVSDVQWLWLDVDAMGTDVLVEQRLPSSPIQLSTTYEQFHLNGNSPVGVAGDRMVHFHRVLYEPRGYQQPAPGFQFGYSTTVGSFAGFVPKVGTQVGTEPVRWGQQRGFEFQGPSPRVVQVSTGCMWTDERPAGNYLPAMRVQDRFVQAGFQTWVFWHTVVSVNLSALLDVVGRYESRVANAAVNIENPFYPWQSIYVPLERPTTGLTENPTVLTHAVVESQGTEWHGPAVATDASGVFLPPSSHLLAEGGLLEGVSSMAWGPTPFSPTAPDIQLRAHFVGGYSQPDALRNVRDCSIVSAFLIKDPDNLPSGQPAEPVPFFIVMGREHGVIGGLVRVPVAPDAAMQGQQVMPERARIDGPTGYGRSWSMFGLVRRRWSLRWTLNKARLDAVQAFLLANECFSFPLPEGGGDIPVCQSGPIETQMQGAPGAIVLTVEVTELVWTN